MAECLPSGVIVLVVSTISLFVVVLGLDCVTIASGPTAPEVVREFLRVSVAEDRGKFYSRSEVRDLLQEYAVKYGTETSAAEKGNIQS